MFSRVKGGVFGHSCAKKGKERIRLKGWCDLKKKLTIVVMVVLAAILIASPVLAAGSSHPMEVANPSPKKQPTIISMTATILTDGTACIDVKIQMTNRAFIQYRGREEPVYIGNAVCYDWVKGKKSIRIDCSQLAKNDKVSINARVDPGSKMITARRVLRRQPRIRIP